MVLPCLVIVFLVNPYILGRMFSSLLGYFHIMKRWVLVSCWFRDGGWVPWILFMHANRLVISLEWGTKLA